MKFQTQDPRTGQTLKTYSYLGDNDIKLSLFQASQQQVFWKQVRLELRIEQLKIVENKLRGMKQELAALMSAEMGKSLAEALAEIDKSLTVFSYYFDLAPRILAPQVVGSAYSESEIRKEPYGIIFAMMPWNFPVWQVVRFAVPAILSGNLVLLKHAEITAGTAELLSRAFDTGDFQLVTNLFLNLDQAAQVIADPKVRAITLTGSTRAGEAVAALAGRSLKKSVLELGGHDAYLIFADADLEKAAKVLTRSRLLNAGQSCVAAKRFLVENSVKDLFLQHLVQEFQKSKPVVLAHAKFRTQVEKQILSLISKGARLVYQAEGCPPFGAFVAPTILEKSKNLVWDEEIFGPVAVVTAFEGEEEGLQLANQSQYGLGGGVFSQDPARLERVLNQLEAGFVVANDVVRSEAGLPFGGQKSSGYGKELGEAGLLEFVQLKTKAKGASA